MNSSWCLSLLRILGILGTLKLKDLVRRRLIGCWDWGGHEGWQNWMFSSRCFWLLRSCTWQSTWRSHLRSWFSCFCWVSESSLLHWRWQRQRHCRWEASFRRKGFLMCIFIPKRFPPMYQSFPQPFHISTRFDVCNQLRILRKCTISCRKSWFWWDLLFIHFFCTPCLRLFSRLHAWKRCNVRPKSFLCRCLREIPWGGGWICLKLKEGNCTMNGFRGWGEVWFFSGRNFFRWKTSFWQAVCWGCWLTGKSLGFFCWWFRWDLFDWLIRGAYLCWAFLRQRVI